MTEITVIIPAKNEERGIGDCLKKLREVCPEYQVVVVNDGSTDSTKAISELAGAIVLNHPYSKGNGAAIKTGARFAKGDLLIFMDADGQHDPSDIPRLIDKLNEGYDLVVGARERGSQASLARGMANRFYNWLASNITGHRVKDLTSGYRVVKAEKFKEFIYLLPNGFSYPTTSTMAFFRAGYSVAYVPIHASKRVGQSHLKIFKDGIRFLLIIFKIGVLYSPLKLFAPISFFLFLSASAWYIYTGFTTGRFTNMSALLYGGSVMVFLMGLISEQITALLYKDKG
ncbi:glycosyltransferase family 2 protein [Marinobacterium litorale]|uniref:glycosyltransferase family 2 protein n=1 Tax=Marinobacterium litorale TaxID=404770 RepID=UPI00047F665A|nr:glycosyltransferase family 2 protein [Marinobacterium litorale]